MMRMRSLLVAAIGLALPFTSPAVAQDYPSKPVRIVVPFAPGGINDVAARLVATQLSEKLGKQFIAENRPGGGGISATEHVIGSPADGYTLLILSIANAVHPAMYKLKYDLLKSIDPVAMVVTSPNTLAVHPDVPAKTVKEFIALAKAKPGEIQYASGGIGGSLHLGMENFRAVTKTDLLHVPFKGAGPAGIDVVAGNTKAIMSTLSSVSTHLKNKRLRGLAISAKERSQVFPDVPTFIEAGVPEYEGGNWIGIGVPAGTPKAVIDLLSKEIAAIQQKPEIQKQMIDRGAAVQTMGPAAFRTHIEKETAKWGKVVKDAGIQPQ
jgi:tripartite-type tricarboxylate transporter receptor subunit TctC